MQGVSIFMVFHKHDGVLRWVGKADLVFSMKNWINGTDTPQIPSIAVILNRKAQEVVPKGRLELPPPYDD